MGKVVMYASVSVDGFVADENDQPGPLFDWLSSGDVPLDRRRSEGVADLRDYTRAYWDQIGVTIAGRRLRHDGLAGTGSLGRDRPRGRRDTPAEARGAGTPRAPFHFVDGVEAAMAKAQELAGDRMVEVAAGDVGGQCLPQAWSTRCAWTSYPWCSGRQALLRVGRRTAPVGGS